MGSLFDVQDPRGYKVSCTDECWEFHILDEHPEMDGLEDTVKETIQTPYLGFIYQDRDYPERNIYYSLDSSREYYVKVVVEFSSEDVGEVITSFLTDSPKPGEGMIWPISKD